MRGPLSLGTALALAVLPGTARADVFEIGAHGAVTVRTSPRGVIEVGATEAVADDEAMPAFPAAALTSIAPPVAPVAYQRSLAQAADAAKVSPALLAALVWQESRWHPAALSPKGARGLTQLMPGTARALAVDPGDASANLAGGARYLRTMLDRFDGNVERALAAYNAGPGRVLRSPGLPDIAETRAYVTAIIDRIGAANASSLDGTRP